MILQWFSLIIGAETCDKCFQLSNYNKLVGRVQAIISQLIIEIRCANIFI